MVSGGRDDTIKVYDFESGNVIKTLKLHGNTVFFYLSILNKII